MSYELKTVVKKASHKKNPHRQVLILPEHADGDVIHFKFHPASVWTVVLTACIVLGLVFGLTFFHMQTVAGYKAIIGAKEDENVKLQDTVTELSETVATLNSQIRILSETVNIKSASEAELTEQIEAQATPSDFPLTGSASIEEKILEDGSALNEFLASPGTTVVSTAAGTVIGVNDDEEYGHNVFVDHGNGYVTIYRNNSDPMVNIGDSVVIGTTLFLISEDNTKLGYQMMYEGEYINPLDMLAING